VSAEKRQTVPFMDYLGILVHRVLAGHKPQQECPQCPYVSCRHCGDFGPRDGDHTCSCPFSDADCPDHPLREADR